MFYNIEIKNLEFLLKLLTKHEVQSALGLSAKSRVPNCNLRIEPNLFSNKILPWFCAPSVNWKSKIMAMT